MTTFLILALLGIGVLGVIRSDNLIRKIMALNIVNSAVIVMYVHFASLSGTDAPIYVGDTLNSVDPLPQALMLTAIVIGLATTAVALVLVVKLHHHFGSLDASEIENRVPDTNG